MVLKKLSVIYILFMFVTNPCHGCEPLEINTDSDSFRHRLEQFLKPLQRVIPQYDDTSVPNAEKLIQQFRLGQDNEDKRLNFTQLATKHGYPVEQYEVKTSDGYLLTMFRIPNSGPPVFLMHGLLGSSDDFIINGPESSLAYILAELGYDVWLGNNRGNKYSRRHVTLSPDCGDYWRYTFEEIGLYDLPAMIDKALNGSNAKKLLFVGHSVGTTAFFVMCSEKPEYNNKITLMIALSADAFFSDIKSPFIRIASLSSDSDAVLVKSVGEYEFFPRDSILNTLSGLFCGSPTTAELVCQSVSFLFFGFDYKQVNATNLPVIYSHFPAGVATKLILHIAESTTSRKFRRYYYDPLKNSRVYGSAEPPEYPLEKVTCPVVIFYSPDDWLTSSAATKQLLEVLPNVVEFYQVPFSDFNHVDYVFAKNVKELVNKEVIRLLNKYTIM